MTDQYQALRKAVGAPEVKCVGMTIHLPIRTQTEANAKEHWRTRHQRAKGQRAATKLYVSQLTAPSLPAEITLTRLGKRKMDDDNVPGALKHVRDELAAWIGVDDGSPLYTWIYRQTVGKEYGVRVEIANVPNRGEARHEA